MKVTVYGFADHEEVEAKIQKRMREVSADSKEALAHMLGEAVFALLEINKDIPVQAKQRYLIAPALENFASGKIAQDTYKAS